MTRLPPITLQRTDLLRRLVLRSEQRLFGQRLQPTSVIAHSRPSMIAYGAVALCHERFAKTVPARLKSLAMLRTAQLIGCEWCLDFGSRLAQDGGVPEADLRELSGWRRAERFDALDRLVLEYAEAMTRTPVEVSDELSAALRGHLDEAQLVELTMAIAAENLFARTNWALGIEGQGFSDGMYCVAAQTSAGEDLVAEGPAR
jgi:AhpD family alkylhydroperoxidase